MCDYHTVCKLLETSSPDKEKKTVCRSNKWNP